VLTGFVDDQLRALIPLSVAAAGEGNPTEVECWIDTAFNGGLVIPRNQIDVIGLTQQSSAEAFLADGSLVELETYGCSIDWFGAKYETQAVANDGEYALIGTMLLAGRRVKIDYDLGTDKVG